MSAGQYIRNYEKEIVKQKFLESKGEIQNLLDVLKDWCKCFDGFDDDYISDKQILDEKFDSKIANVTNTMKEVFHSNSEIDGRKHKFVDDERGELSIDEVGLIYRFVEILKS